MELKLHLDGSVEPLSNYLKNFLKIRKSILLEIDTKQRAIVAKTFSDDHSSVRFSSITFNDAHLTIVSDTNENERGDARIKVGVLLLLNKLIQIIDRFGSMGPDGKSDFEIVIKYDILQSKGNVVDYIATDILFNSEILKMRMKGFRTAELDYLSDEEFKDIFNVMDPVSIEVSSETIETIIKTSDIIKYNPREDMLMFYVENGALYVRDSRDAAESKFVFKIGDVDNNPNYEIALPVTREFFVKMMDKGDESYRIILGHDDDGVISRILFDSTTSSTKIISAGMLNE